MSSDEALTVGIVLKRRRSNHPWQDHVWQAAEIVAGIPPADEWRLLRDGDGETTYLAGTRPLRLFRGETEGYLLNLSQHVPMVYVVLRRAEDDPERPLRPFHVTVCPTEAQDYLDGDDLVEAVPMPPVIAGWLQDFVRRFHVDRPFEKRGRKERDARRRADSGPDGPAGRMPGDPGTEHRDG